MLQQSHHRKHVLGLAALVLFGLMLTSTSHARRTAAVLPIEANSPEDVPLTKTITASIRRALSGFDDLIDRGLMDFSLAEAKMSFNCPNERPACMAKVGATVEVRTLFWGHIQRTRAGLKVVLRGVDVNAKRYTYSIDVVLRDAIDLEQNIDDIAHAFLAGRPYTKVRQTALRLRSTPSGADVRIDGRPYGPTPVEAVIPSGRHRIVLELPGYRPQSEEITIGGPSETLRYSLQRDSIALSPKIEAPQETSTTHWSFWTGIGVSVVSLGAMTTGIVLHTQAYQIRQDEFVARDDFSLADNALARELSATGTTPMRAAQIEMERVRLESEYEANYADRKVDYDSAVSSANIALAVGGVTAAAAVYLLFFHESEPEVSLSHNGMGLGFNF